MKTKLNNLLRAGLSGLSEIIAIILLFICLFLAGQIKAQDLILRRDGTEISGKVLEIGENQIKYKTGDNLQFQRSVLKTDVFMIKYANGTKEVFDEKRQSPPMYTYNNPPTERDRRFDPDTSDFAKLRQKRLNGPRIGFTMIGPGTSSDYLNEKNKRSNLVQFGWQFETVLFTAGNTAGLLEFVPLIGGFEQGMFIPSLNVLLGIRGGNPAPFEFALGPNFSLGRNYKGDVAANLGLVIAVGTSYTKDKVHFPITLAFVPSVGSTENVTDDSGNTVTKRYETGWRISLLVGFNTRKR